MIRLLCSILLALLVVPGLAHGQQNQLDTAFNAAIATFERALPHLSASEFGVDVAAYRDALTLQRFSSAVWGGEVTAAAIIRDGASGSCSRYAAFVRIPPENGVVDLVLCPQFFRDGTDALRELTILHEIVHVVAGRDECQAMAFAARVEMAAKGNFTPVDAYWQASGCADSAYSLP
jgi:hypothetical protein